MSLFVTSFSELLLLGFSDVFSQLGMQTRTIRALPKWSTLSVFTAKSFSTPTALCWHSSESTFISLAFSAHSSFPGL